MNNLKRFLDRFRNLRAPDASVKETFVRILEKEIGIVLSTKDIELVGSTLHIRAHPTLKSEVYLRKKHLLKCLLEEGVTREIKNIL